MKHLMSIWLLSFCLLQVHGQGFGVAVNGGIGTYNLDDLSAFQAELIPTLPVEVKQFADFPAFTNLEVTLFRKAKNNRIGYGLLYAFSTSGTHANYRDFSGYLNLDQRFEAYQLGIMGSYTLSDRYFENSKLELAVLSNVRMAYNRNSVTAEINTSYYYESTRMLMRGISPAGFLGLNGNWKKNNVGIGIEGGYLLDAGTTLEIGEESAYESTIDLTPDREIRSNISGFRIGIKLQFWLGRPQPQDQVLPTRLEVKEQA